MSAAVSSGPLRVPLLSPLLYTGRDNDEEIIIHLRDKILIQSFKLKKNAELGEVFGAFAIKCGISLESLRFMHDGVRLVSTSIPNNCGLKDNDHIDVLMEQKGGFDIIIAPSLFAVSLCC
jgi:small ubiquitin-related modifier